jgi:hypothetical protein
VTSLVGGVNLTQWFRHIGQKRRCTDLRSLKPLTAIVVEA